MRIPKQVMILGHKVSIKQTSKLPSGDADTLGVADVLDDVIHLHKDMSNEAKYKILLHEIFHHALWANGVSQTISPEIEECIVQAFASVYREIKKQGI